MTMFNREFDVSGVKAVLSVPENAWFRDLLKYWRPAGDLGDAREKPLAGGSPATRDSRQVCQFLSCRAVGGQSDLHQRQA